MEENKEMLELLRKIEASGRRRTVAAWLTCLFMLVSAVSCVVLCITLVNLMPQASAVIDQLEVVTGQLAELELEALVNNVDSLAQYAQESLELTMEKLDAIDFETLNKAIGDLSKVIEPLANFFQRFGG